MMLPPLSFIQLNNPFIWALIIGWVLTVSIHEFAHGIVAHFGGDYTISQRGGLTLNPFQFLDPVNSLIMPIIFLMVGGLPLPGGVTYVRTDLLKNKYWESAVSLAGPASNLIIYVVLSLIVHPKIGWVDGFATVQDWSFPQQFIACLAFLQLYAFILNMIPIPPLDGFGTIRPFLPREIHDRIMAPPIPMICTIGFFILIFATPLSGYLLLLAVNINQAIGFSDNIPSAFVHLFLNR